jgi:hypothetical protein
MQHSVDDIEEQLLTGRPSAFLGDSFCGLPANDHFPFEVLVVVGEVKADHVGGVIVVEVLAIDVLNRPVVDDGDGDLTGLPSEILGDGFDSQKGLLAEGLGDVARFGNEDFERHGYLRRLRWFFDVPRIPRIGLLFRLGIPCGPMINAHPRNPREARQNWQKPFDSSLRLPKHNVVFANRE